MAEFKGETGQSAAGLLLTKYSAKGAGILNNSSMLVDEYYARIRLQDHLTQTRGTKELV